MKVSILKISFMALLMSAILSCEEDEGFHQISVLETQIHNKINDYRQTQGLPKLVMQFVMFEEAHLHSVKMANGLVAADGTGMDEAFASVKDKLGGTTEGYVILTSPYPNADSIVKYMLDNPDVVGIIKQTYTQSGVGVDYNDDGIAYVTHMFLNIP